ncbi:MAG: hypothetical protein Q8S13_14625, partial [Dehalococcoidia bacterium]|nr:hypothetical protein [Dehalococcoidia bacterium]
AGAGVVATNTPRTTLASNDPAVTALEIIDDWDETNRAAVNPIAGQVGIAGGTGVDGATVPRVTLATNVALPTGANTIGDVTVTELPAAAVLADGVANPTTTNVTTHPLVYNGATWDRVRGDTANGIDIDVTRIAAGDNNIGNMDVLSFPDTEPVNFAQISGTAASVSLGNTDAGTQRSIEASTATLDTGLTACTDVDNVAATTVLAAYAGRRHMKLCNQSTVRMYCAQGATPTSTSYHHNLRAGSAAHDSLGDCFSADHWGGALSCLSASDPGGTTLICGVAY